MPPNRESFTKEWFRKAKMDLDSAERLLNTEPALTETAAFLCQQGVEKSIKGFLTFHKISFRKTHDLEELGQKVLVNAPTLEPLMKKILVLQQFAVEIRYPGEDEPPTEVEAKRYLELSKEVFQMFYKAVICVGKTV